MPRLGRFCRRCWRGGCAGWQRRRCAPSWNTCCVIRHLHAGATDPSWRSLSSSATRPCMGIRCPHPTSRCGSGRPDLHRRGAGPPRHLAGDSRSRLAEVAPQGARPRSAHPAAGRVARYRHAPGIERGRPEPPPRGPNAIGPIRPSRCLRPLPRWPRRPAPSALRPVPRPPAARWPGARSRPWLPWPCAPRGRPCRCPRGSGGRR